MSWLIWWLMSGTAIGAFKRTERNGSGLVRTWVSRVRKQRIDWIFRRVRSSGVGVINVHHVRVALIAFVATKVALLAMNVAAM